MTEPIYLDHNATTPVDPRVLEKMLPYFSEIYGNASSIDHLHGNRSKKAVDAARQTIAKLLGCRKDNEVIFTGGATEANNLALIGSYRRLREKGRHIISSAIEHPAVLDTLHYLENEGAEVTLLPVDCYGVVDIQALQAAIRSDTILISVMFANNEIGTIQPIKEIGEVSKKHGVLFHVDAAQAVGHEPLHVYDLNIDLLSFSAHKFYGPKGVGGLFVRTYAPMVRLDAVMFGGGQERGLRPGTLNVPAIVGMAEALAIAVQGQKAERERLGDLSATIKANLLAAFPGIIFNGHPEKRLQHNLNITIPGVEAKGLIHLLKDRLSFSAGSACSTTKVEPSHVLKAIGLSDDECFQTIRFGAGRSTMNSLQISEILIEGIRKLN
ncbi:cysteine desulfurase family protein [Citrifermentans bremense]|uniref:cysteine desulfurase family protein n=1 Tax=Citrifermentans bremense TaxID=60035 RepID=UPI000411C57F|nr:cysteine desulfurase family protein [Citrifermentans bremense]